jgi:acyl-coenzyme A synthetase/AMP-(fatty) acid ligase
MQNHDATIFAAAPGVYRKCLSNDNFPALPRLRHGLSAGEKLSATLHNKWKKQTKTNIYEAFGMSECSTFVSSSPQAPADRNTIGRPQAGRRVAILAQDGSHEPVELGQTGIIAIDRSDQGLMLGYVNVDKDNTGSSWFLTGDLGKMSESGSITYLGRDDDVITAGGYRVSPLEVEAQLQSHPDIISIAVSQVEVKQDTWVVAAFYTAQAEIETDVLKEFAGKLLAKYKQPRVYVYREALPTGPNGKILRRALRLPKGLSDGET